MKLKTSVLITFLLITNQTLRAQPPSPDPFGESLFPPELVMHFQSEIGLTEQQRNFILTNVQKMQTDFADKEQQLQKEVEKLAGVLKKERIEMEVALAQVDKVLSLEQGIKRAHLALIIGIKNKLSPEQQTKLQEIKKLTEAGKPATSVEAKIQSKLEKVKAGVEQWQNDGRDPSSIGELVQEFEPLMKAGKTEAAAALLDKAIKLLGESK